jgi:hypothetical protein
MVKHKAKYWLQNYQCGNCESGVVQIHQSWKRGGTVTTIVSGCLDCGHDYGIRQAQELEKYHRDDIVWP